MSQSTFFLILMSGHALGDFYFQSKSMVKRKVNSPKSVFTHVLWYTLVMVVAISPVIQLRKDSVWLVPVLLVIIYISHAIPDFLKIPISSFNATDPEINLLSLLMSFFKKYIFFLDQAVHITSLILISYVFSGCFAPNKIGYALIAWEKSFLSIIPVRPLVLFVAIMYIIKPTGTAISAFLSTGSDTLKKQDEGFKNAGFIIGVLERLLILSLLMANQYGAIGFVFTAKSVARYAEINNKRLEAEYYLIGTHLSLVSVGLIMLLMQMYSSV